MNRIYNMKKKTGREKALPFLYIMVLFLTASFAPQPESGSETLQSLAQHFQAPPMQYRPHVWWHWMGSNFRKEGITKDLEAMKEAGIAGATIFNIASSVQNTHEPMLNNPWPEQTFRSKAYWDAMKHTMKEAKRLGLTMGLHGTPGYATTGGPWIPEERSMKTLVFSQTQVEGGKTANILLLKPELPAYHGINNEVVHEGVVTSRPATYYKDVAVMAVPDKANVEAADIIDISRFMDAEGRLQWQAPQGKWTIYRTGESSTMANPHPLPDDIIGKSLEVDKMSREDNIFHWQQLLDPLKENIGQYFGNTFMYIWVDSYESGNQDWTPKFREEFARLKGYDPLPYLVLRQYIGTKDARLKSFWNDNTEVINRLFIDNGWKTSKEMLHKYGLKMYWEPYWGPFDTDESTAIPDMPIGEFWTRKDGAIMGIKAQVAAEADKHIVAAEAFTGRPLNSQYTEDPAFLKRFADGGYASGANLYFLHHWVHQPFDDRYQPGMGMGWWGTHFSRFQTWFKPGKAFFTYLARCQMLLQQGKFVPTNRKGIAHRSMAGADIFFITNPDSLTGVRTYAFGIKDRTPELWDAYHGIIRKTNHWRAAGDSIYVDLRLEPDGSMFIVFPKEKLCAYDKLRQPAAKEVIEEKEMYSLNGNWNITFQPKLDKPFKCVAPLSDFSQSPDTAIKYFAGTASYETVIRINAAEINPDNRIILDLGELHDIAELEINGKPVSVLWHSPYKADITPHVKMGDNRLTVHVSVNWANRLIGDEQYPADFEWGRDRGEEGRAMKGYPDWFIQNKLRPSQRKAFTIWYYFRKDSPLYPAGLLGPVRLISQTVSEKPFSMADAIPVGAKPFDFYGFQGYDFTFMGRNAKVVMPKIVAPNRPWNWRARFWGGEPQTDIALLEQGFHIVYCDVSELFGNQEALSIWNEFYLWLQKAGLAKKSSMEGMSRGGVYIYRWAATYPDRVFAIYADAPVLDLKSWPGGKGKGKAESKVWETFKKDFGFTTEDEALAFDGNPLDLTGKIVAGGYPMLHVVGDADEVVPVDENTTPFEQKIRAAGGSIQVIHKPGIGHHPHSLKDPAPIVAFILKAMNYQHQ